ncbi:hypothetical protein GMJAKD_06825 [Candidatus Electrothrix aarhusensis]
MKLAKKNHSECKSHAIRTKQIPLFESRLAVKSKRMQTGIRAGFYEPVDIPDPHKTANQPW